MENRLDLDVVKLGEHFTAPFGVFFCSQKFVNSLTNSQILSLFYIAECTQDLEVCVEDLVYARRCVVVPFFPAGKGGLA